MAKKATSQTNRKTIPSPAAKPARGKPVVSPKPPVSANKPQKKIAAPVAATAKAASASNKTIPAQKRIAEPAASPVKQLREPAKAAKPRESSGERSGQRSSDRSSERNGKKSSTESRSEARPVNHYVPPPPAVATNLKPRKNQAGINVKELEHYRDLLLEKRREIVGDMSSMEREALRSSGGSNLSTLPIHMADMGTDNYEQEFTLGLVEKDRNLLREINDALAKIQNGTFGICEGTGKPIGKPRLLVQPWARYSIEFARQREKSGMGVR